jgi:hypothetical protein
VATTRLPEAALRYLATTLPASEADLADGDPVPNRLYRVEELTGFPDAQLEALARRYEDKLRLAAKDDCIPDEASDAA